MRFFNKYFFIGLVTGLFLVCGAAVIGVYVFLTTYEKDNTESLESMLAVPNMPDTSHISVLGKADPNWIVSSLEGNKVNFRDFQGKLVFLNIWATWCTPCVIEMPTIQRLYDSLKNEQIVFLIASNESEEKIRGFIEKYKYTFPFYLYEGTLPKDFQTRGIPATFIIDKDGMIIFKHIGAAKWDDNSVISFLRQNM